MLIFDAKNLYYLEISLQFEVFEDKADAKFDRKRKELRITLPIVPALETKFEINNDVPFETDEETLQAKTETVLNSENQEIIETKEEKFLKSEEKIVFDTKKEENPELQKIFESEKPEIFESKTEDKLFDSKNEEILESENKKTESEKNFDEKPEKTLETEENTENFNEEKENIPSLLQTFDKNFSEEQKQGFSLVPCCLTLKSPLLFDLL